ncbi:unnamed protein product [Rhodiola kirilowii]
MPTSFDSDSIAIARLNARVEAMGTKIVAREEKQSSDMLQVFLAIEKLARSIDNLKSSVKKIPNPHDQPIRQNLTPLVPTTSIENENVISTKFGSNHQRVSLETVGKSQGVMKSEIIFCDLNGLEHSCPLAVCENDLVDFTFVFVTKMDLVGSWCPTQPFKLAPVYVQPPAKPPDKSINMLQMLDSHMIPMLISISLKYVILHVLEGVLAVERSDFDLLSSVRLEYLNTRISRLQTNVFYVDLCVRT